MRPTWLQFRSPKEETPGPIYNINLTNEGAPVNHFHNISVTKRQARWGGGGTTKNTFSTNHRFQTGSIYEIPMKKTTKMVGPGIYNSNEMSFSYPSKNVSKIAPISTATNP